VKLKQLWARFVLIVGVVWLMLLWSLFLRLVGAGE
jgi:hypothetical protein